jgi:putative membrane protein
VLAAIKMFDDLLKNGEDAEVATICGDVEVGTRSDRALMRQLEEVIEVIEPTSAILVSNGAEDEYIVPMICARVKVDSVKSVFVRQSARIESTYYYIVKNLKDPKMRMKFVLPIGLALILIGIAYLIQFFFELSVNFKLILEPARYVLQVISILLGGIILWRSYNVSDNISQGLRDWRDATYAGDVSIIHVVGALIIVAVGAALGYYDAAALGALNWFDLSLIFFSVSIPWFTAAYIILEARKVVNALLHHDYIPSEHWSVMVSSAAIGFLLLAAVHFLMFVTNMPESVEMFYILVEGGIGVGLMVTSLLYQRRKRGEVVAVRDRWRR